MMVAATVAGTVACNRGPGAAPATGYNVLIVLADALRADHLGLYGYPRETSPFVDSMATQGVVFDHAATPSTFTGQALTAIFSGRPPSLNASPGWLSEPREDYRTIAEIFRDAGYRTAFISPTPVLGSTGFKAGFDVVEQHPDLEDPALSARLAETAIEFISANRDRPFLAYVHFFDPHEPYAPRPETYREVGGGPRSPSEDAIIKEQAFELSKLHFGPGDPAYEDLILKYDAEIRDVDRQFRRIFDHLGNLGLDRKTLVVFLSDHGDELWEHDYLDHAWTLYQETVHVPLIFWAPAALGPARREDRVSTLDLYATLAGLTGLSGDAEAWSVNLFGSSYDADAPRPLISELLLKDRTLVRTVTAGPWKLHSWVKYVPPRQRYPPAVTRWNQVLTEQQARLDPWGPSMKRELFQLGWDSGEQVNVIARFPRIAERLDAELDRLRRRAQESEADDAPKADAEADQRLERLRSLGYVQSDGDAEAASDLPPFDPPLYEPGTRLELGSPDAESYLPYGWSIPEGERRWTDGDEAMLWFRLDSPTAMKLRIEGVTFGAQAVRLFVNGRRVATLWPDVRTHEIEIPAHMLGGLNRIVFSVPKSTSPERLQGEDDGRELGFAAEAVTLSPHGP